MAKIKYKAPPVKTTEEVATKKVKMIFPENKFYRDPVKPLFESGKIYELEGDDWIARWQKRGGKIVDAKDAPSDKQVKTEETDLQDDGQDEN